MVVRVRAWLLACTMLLLLLVPIAIAGTVVAASDRGQGAIAASQPYGTVATAPAQSVSVTRQAYDLLLDNFVTPPPPASLLSEAATEVGRRAGDTWPSTLTTPLASLAISMDASRDDAWVAFDAWLDRAARVLSPVIDRAALDDLAVRALASAMSEHHTRYLDPRQNQEHQAWRRGEVRYEGIGARLRRPTTVVLEVFDDSPAAKAGLRTGDKIVAVNGESVANESSENAISLIRGPLGSSVEVVVERRGTAQQLRF